ncbi:unnamed protein product [Darwinula stevensoni]|uniref:Uncharacterized protein n=1 Tax=Darwinula stevensoni TaxID=69355 RepID=A0A7R8X074_9CRUS|nr:unnamed protein product [Darwinula stevensoni]CAG0880908.1 unnamed protein product [Darwinula stevensoni]
MHGADEQHARGGHACVAAKAFHHPDAPHPRPSRLAIGAATIDGERWRRKEAGYVSKTRPSMALEATPRGRERTEGKRGEMGRRTFPLLFIGGIGARSDGEDADGGRRWKTMMEGVDSSHGRLSLRGLTWEAGRKEDGKPSVAECRSVHEGQRSLMDESCSQDWCVDCLEDAGCRECLHMLLPATGECVDACPDRTVPSLASAQDKPLQGLLCKERKARSLLGMLGMTEKEMVVLIGACGGGAICVGILIGTALLYMRHRRLKGQAGERHPHRCARGTDLEAAFKAQGKMESQERGAFLEQLSKLRPEASNFLDMLEETRKRFQKLASRTESRSDSKAKAYRAVLRDLSRVISLLTRKPEHIRTIPKDWERLLSWAERVLRRYKRQKATQSGEADGVIYQKNPRPHAQSPALGSKGARGSQFSITPIVMDDAEPDLPPPPSQTQSTSPNRQLVPADRHPPWMVHSSDESDSSTRKLLPPHRFHETPPRRSSSIPSSLASRKDKSAIGNKCYSEEELSTVL